MVGWSDEPSRRLASRVVRHLSVLGVLSAGACAFDFGGVVYDDAASTTTSASGSTSTGPGGDGGATTTTTGPGGDGGGGGGGDPVACGDVECPIVECYETSCEGEACLLAPLEEGSACGPQGAQTCTNAQDCVACADAEDCAPPLSSCRTVGCVEGACVETAVPEREPCIGEAGVCSAAQACVECVDEAECSDGEVCVAGVCTTPAATCFDGALNAGETGVDCGGPCPPCPNGLGCLDAGDCQSGFCNGVCAPCTSSASCSDGTWCSSAGACILRSGNGAPCSVADECVSGSCVDGVCCNDPCNGTCSSCRAADTGSSDGVCAAVLVGKDPDFECEDGECRSGSCDGAGQCGVVVGECSATCVMSGDLALVYPGACYQGECGHTIGNPCEVGWVCNDTMTDCEPKE